MCRARLPSLTTAADPLLVTAAAKASEHANFIPGKPFSRKDLSVYTVYEMNGERGPWWCTGATPVISSPRTKGRGGTAELSRPFMLRCSTSLARCISSVY